MTKKIQLKRAKELFPNEITRLSRHDFLNLRVDKADLLDEKEKEDFEKIANFELIPEGSDILVKRKKGRIELDTF